MNVNRKTSKEGKSRIVRSRSEGLSSKRKGNKNPEKMNNRDVSGRSRSNEDNNKEKQSKQKIGARDKSCFAKKLRKTKENDSRSSNNQGIRKRREREFFRENKRTRRGSKHN